MTVFDPIFDRFWQFWLFWPFLTVFDRFWLFLTVFYRVWPFWTVFKKLLMTFFFTFLSVFDFFFLPILNNCDRFTESIHWWMMDDVRKYRKYTLIDDGWWMIEESTESTERPEYLCSTLRSWLHEISTTIKFCPLDWRKTIHWNVVQTLFQHNHISQDCWKNSRSIFECMVILKSRGQGQKKIKN